MWNVVIENRMMKWIENVYKMDARWNGCHVLLTTTWWLRRYNSFPHLLLAPILATTTSTAIFSEWWSPGILFWSLCHSKFRISINCPSLNRLSLHPFLIAFRQFWQIIHPSRYLAPALFHYIHHTKFNEPPSISEIHPQVLSIVICEERNRPPGPSSPASPTKSMNITHCSTWEIVIHNQLDPQHIKPSAKHISADEDPSLASTKLFYNFISFLFWHVRMDDINFEGKVR